MHHLIAHHHVVHAIAAAVIVHPHLVRTMVAVHLHATRVLIRAVRTATAALLARKPRISVITPTWQRRDLLTSRCVPSVRAQSYDGPVEHIIVSDGPDPCLEGVAGVIFLDAHRRELNKGVSARLAGAELAAGDLIAYLDDDNAWRPDHLELLAGAIEKHDVSFAYSRAACSNGNGCRWEIGCAPPVFGQVDTSMIVHRRGLLETAAWEPSGVPADWHLVSRWLAAGARWAHVPRITLDYFASTPLLTGQALHQFRDSHLRAVQQPA